MTQELNHRHQEDEGSGYLMSVSDMMSGLLFVFIITLVAFIINFQEAIQKEEETRKTYEKTVKRLVDSKEVRKQLLYKLEEELKKKGIQVEIDEYHGVLRLTEQAIRFESGSATLKSDQFKRLKLISETFADILPCYSANLPNEGDPFASCNEILRGKIDSILIEGHTDNQPVSVYAKKRFKDNWELSALRAIYTFRALIPDNPVLNQMRNTDNQPIFSVSGFGDGRPLPGHSYEAPTADKDNRRIDLRFIMTPPSETEVEKDLRAAGLR